MMQINGIEFELTGETFEIKGRGTVHTGTLASNEAYTWNSVNEALIGQTFKGKPIRGVEMFAIEWQSGRPIGILI